ncbi:hypothetical protein F4815DRAFT_476678 [Daldinia loculata]|nr:hypothetical protein F4815DRAFT_476678 [Daldinia loculata]
MEVNFQFAETNLTPCERSMLNVLKATLQYPVDSPLKATKLCSDIQFFCNSQQENTASGGHLWEIWSVVIEMVQYISPDHPWQDVLVQCLGNLRRQEGHVPKHGAYMWKDLPDLAMRLRENWNDPTETGEELPEEFIKWKNLNSFVARITSTDFAPWLVFPIWQLTMALEEPPVAGGAMECRVWVATEWIIHCAAVLFEEMNSTEQLDDSTARAFMTGPLCDTEEPLSIKRWNFWKRRLLELSTDTGDLALSGEARDRISNALESMDYTEK